MALDYPVKVTAELAAIIGKEETTRPEVTKLLWVYIKAHNLQSERDKRVIMPDAALAKVIGTEPINMMKMTGQVSKHISKK